MWQAFLQKMAHILSVLDGHDGSCMVLLTIGLVICAGISCGIAAWNIRIMKQLDAKRSSPYVVIETTHNRPCYGVRLVNMGLTAARNVRVTATPKIEIALSKFPKPIRFIEEGIAVLVPNETHTTDLGTFEMLQKNNPSLVYRCMVSYESDWGEKFTTECVLDYSLYDGLAYRETKTVHDLTKQFESFARDFHLLASGFHKLHVLTEDYDDYNEKIDEIIEQATSSQQPANSSDTQAPEIKEAPQS